MLEEGDDVAGCVCGERCLDSCGRLALALFTLPPVLVATLIDFSCVKNDKIDPQMQHDLWTSFDLGQ